MAKTKKEKKAKAVKAASGDGKSVIDRSKYNYEPAEEKTAGGKRHCIDNGDDVAKVLRGKTTDEVLTIAELNGATREQVTRWKDRNPGMARMNAGNFLRSIARKGGKIKVSERKSVETAEVGGTAAAA